jgi:hypothetical protein
MVGVLARTARADTVNVLGAARRAALSRGSRWSQ